MMKTPFLTIFTPTYNRADLLPRLYSSLKNQNNKDFEWIIIDDGSTDNTESLVKEWRNNDNNFEIIYKKVRNGGKHRAINLGVELARGKMFFIVDSDDWLLDKATLFIVENEKTLPKNGFAGLSGRKAYSNGSLIGDQREPKRIDSTSLERKKNGISGDQAEVFYTAILREHPFPEIEGENFIEEALVWNRIARDGLKIRWLNTAIYIAEYRKDGLTAKKSAIQRKNIRGYRMYVFEFAKSGAPFKDRVHLLLYYFALRLRIK